MPDGSVERHHGLRWKIGSWQCWTRVFFHHIFSFFFSWRHKYSVFLVNFCFLLFDFFNEPSANTVEQKNQSELFFFCNIVLSDSKIFVVIIPYPFPEKWDLVYLWNTISNSRHLAVVGYLSRSYLKWSKNLFYCTFMLPNNSSEDNFYTWNFGACFHQDVSCKIHDEYSYKPENIHGIC